MHTKHFNADTSGPGAARRGGMVRTVMLSMFSICLLPAGPTSADQAGADRTARGLHTAGEFRIAQGRNQRQLTPEELERRKAKAERRSERKGRKEKRKEERRERKVERREGREQRQANPPPRAPRAERPERRRSPYDKRPRRANPEPRSAPRQLRRVAPAQRQPSPYDKRPRQAKPEPGSAPQQLQRVAPRDVQPDGNFRRAAPREERRRDFRATTREERKRRRNERRARGERRAPSEFGNFESLKRGRRVERLKGDNEVILEPDARRIIRSGKRAFVTRDETRRMRRFGKSADSRRRPGGGNITTIVRPDGTRIVTETSPDGRLIGRYRLGRDGRRHYLVDNRRTWRKWGSIAAGAALATGLLIAIDPPRYRLPRDRYIIDYDRSSYDDIYDALYAPPISRLDRRYSLDEVLFTPNLRAYMRRIDLSTINFASGSWQVDEDQFDELEGLARAMDRIIDRNRDEVFLIEGHTDAVGDPIDNKTLSDRRAEEVANILTEEFDIPPENLVTQGYGEDHLKVDTDGPSAANRRVTIRRITPLLERRTARFRN